jgi:hypothetical protein
MAVCPDLTTERAVVDVGLERVERAAEEEPGVVVVERPAKSSMLNGPGGVPGDAVLVRIPSPVSRALACDTPTW